MSEVRDSETLCELGSNNAGPCDMTLNEARGGESDCRRALPPSIAPWVRSGPGRGCCKLVASPMSGARSTGRVRCLPRLSSASNGFALPEVPTCRSVNGFAVAAACLLYSLYKLYGVAAPGLLSADLQEQGTRPLSITNTRG